MRSGSQLHRRNWRHGLSLTEVTIMLVVIAILTAVLTPTVSQTIQKARVQRCIRDERAISQAILEFLADTGRETFRCMPPVDPPSGLEECVVQLLVSDGDIPSGKGGDPWRVPVDFQQVDFLEYHLVTNNPGNQAANRYPAPGDNPGMPNAPAWRGAYLNAPINSDPWGNRYAVNVGFLASGSKNADIVIISAGPDEEIDSQYQMDGFVPGDDDITCLVSPGNKTP